MDLKYKRFNNINELELFIKGIKINKNKSGSIYDQIYYSNLLKELYNIKRTFNDPEHIKKFNKNMEAGT